MESIIKDIICSSLLSDGRTTKQQQNAFITKRSTTTNLLENTYYWTLSLNNRNPVAILNIDFSKTFDFVVHIVSSVLSYSKSVFLIYSFNGSLLSFQTDSNKLELKMLSCISHDSLSLSPRVSPWLYTFYTVH